MPTPLTDPLTPLLSAMTQAERLCEIAKARIPADGKQPMWADQVAADLSLAIGALQRGRDVAFSLNRK